jgi:hypothetical protein
LKQPLNHPLPNLLPNWYDAALFCNYHQVADHAINNCHTLRDAIQDLIDNKAIVIQNTEVPPTP